MAITINGSGSLGGVTSLPTTGLQLADSNMPAGSVLQVVQNFSTTSTEITTIDTWYDTASSVTITPTSSSSNILILHTAPGLWNVTSGAANARGIRLMRNSDIAMANDRTGYRSTTGWHGAPWSLVYLDSPSSTSALTYKIQIGMDGGSANLRHNDSDSWGGNVKGASLIAMEIAG